MQKELNGVLDKGNLKELLSNVQTDLDTILQQANHIHKLLSGSEVPINNKNELNCFIEGAACLKSTSGNIVEILGNILGFLGA